ncbi:MAG: A/G-specific adenine glycosylase [Pseudomonadota bacterium]
MSANSTVTPRQALLAWYDRHRRTLPWRAEPGDRADPYHVLVSEVMLQQTTVATVTPRFREFVTRFPTLKALAAASIDDVLHAWQGLGYYRRARLLHQCAIAAVQHYDGRLPDKETKLLRLPGIGAYTANAVAAIAFERPVVPVDGNVERVLARLVALRAPPKTLTKEIREAAAPFIGTERASDCAQALMELGALICRPKNAQCARCPLSPDCLALRSGLVDEIPAKPKKTPRPERYAVSFMLCHPELGVLFRRRPETGLLAGMIEIPSTTWRETPYASKEWLAAAPVVLRDWTISSDQVRHIFTHLALNLEIARATTEEVEVADKMGGFWCPTSQFGTLALPTLTRKVLRAAGLEVPR